MANKRKRKPQPPSPHWGKAITGLVVVTLALNLAVAQRTGERMAAGEFAPNTGDAVREEPVGPETTPPSRPLTSLSVREFAFYAADQAGIDRHVFWGLILSESGGNPDIGCSKAGACGIGQLMEATAREMGVDRADWRENLVGSAFYLAKKLREFDGDENSAIAAYNAGRGTISRWWAKGGHFERLPLETQKYVGKVRMNESKSRRQVQLAMGGR